MKGVLFHLRVLSILSAITAFTAGCSSGPDKHSEPDPVQSQAQAQAEKTLAAELPVVDGEDSRERARSSERISAMGPSMCRALSREIDQRIEAEDIGPGFVCLLRLLGALGGENAVKPLQNTALKRTLEPSCRVEAIRSLACSGIKACVAALLECITDGEPLPVRIAAAAALALFTDDSQARESLKTVLSSGPDPLRAEAARSLLCSDDEDLRGVYLPRLMDACALVRLAAIAYFRRHPDVDASGVMRVLSGADSDMRVVAAAGRALAEME